MPHAPDLSGVALNGRYELHAVIGEGAFGRVYRGRDRRLARPVAVKVIKPWWAEDPEWVRSFEREAQLLASVSDPGIVQIYDVGSAPEGLYYVAELVAGKSLVSHLAGGRLAPEQACEIAEQLARALASAHAQRVVHRDVKPANVLISADGRVKVADFGVARLAEGSSEGGGTIAGTPRYMAPEQARGASTTPATDVYGVGVILYEMLSGHPPFEGSSPVELAFQHVHDDPPALPVSTPPTLERIIDRALAKDPCERYPDAAALAAALTVAKVALQEDPEPGPATGTVATLAPPATARTTRIATPRPVAAPAPQATKVGQPYSRRKNLNPPERRRRVALLALIVLLGAGMAAAAILLAPGHVRVPNLHGLGRGRANAVARHDGLRVTFTHRYSSAAKGTVVAQSPRARARVDTGTDVRATLSAGPAPVPVPDVTGKSSSDARSVLADGKLHGVVLLVPGFGAQAGTVLRQSPRAGGKLLPGKSVDLFTAEAPRFRSLTRASGASGGHTVPFQIRGSRWRIVSSMGYQGTCTFIFICSGPSATVTNLRTGQKVAKFDLGNGSGQVQSISSGPGLYEVSITPGSDSARWSLKVDDYY